MNKLDLYGEPLEGNSPELGKSYVALKDVHIPKPLSDGSKYYKEGEVYVSENEGCITDETGDTEHIWEDAPGEFTFSDTFKELVN